MDETLHISPAEESKPRQEKKTREGRGRGPRPGQRSPLRAMELVMNGVFFFCGIVAIVFVLFISVYLIISGLPAIAKIGLVDFLFGRPGPPPPRTPSSASCPLSSPPSTAPPARWCWAFRWV